MPSAGNITAQITRVAMCRLALRAVCSRQPGRTVHLLSTQAVCQALYKQYSVIVRWALVAFSLQVRTPEAQVDEVAGPSLYSKEEVVPGSGPTSA